MKIAIFVKRTQASGFCENKAYNSNGINVVAIFHEEGNILKGIVEKSG